MILERGDGTKAVQPRVQARERPFGEGAQSFSNQRLSRPDIRQNVSFPAVSETYIVPPNVDRAS